MIQQPNEQYAQQPVTFADNWSRTTDEVLQLLISDAIWKRLDVHPDQQVKVSKNRSNPEEGLYIDTYFLNDKPIMKFSKCFGNDKIPMHFTIFV